MVPALKKNAYLYLHAASLAASCLWRLFVAVGWSTDTAQRPSRRRRHRRRRIVSRLRRLLTTRSTKSTTTSTMWYCCCSSSKVVCVPKRDPNGDEVYRSLKESWKDFVC